MTGKLSYKPGAKVSVNGETCVIEKAVDLDRVLVTFAETGNSLVVPTRRIEAVGKQERKAKPSEALSEADYQTARYRFEIIKSLLELDRRSKGKEIAKIVEAKVASSSTIYRWIKAFLRRGLLSDLAPARRQRRKNRLTKKIEAIISDVIQTIYLTRQKPTIRKAHNDLVIRCKRAGLKAPTYNTLRDRINRLDVSEVTARRHGAKAARDKYAEVKAEFPGADYPLAVVQVDHTPLDIAIVDHHRHPIGRPWLTLAMDVYSRMVTGFYLSLDAPSAFSVGMCIRHSALRKEKDLDHLKVNGEWPVWGLMKTLHTDNGKDFRSSSIQKACDEYAININWRPVKQPHYGGNVERLLGTINHQIHTLPGSTFSNSRSKGEYNSEKEAVFTLYEIEQWLTEYIVNVYHRSPHKTLGMAPIEKWRSAILGDGKCGGSGLPELVGDIDKFIIDFLPFETRVVQRQGIVWDNVWYYGDALRPWINRSPGKTSNGFIVKRDPRDISQIWFFDPKVKEYFRIPYRNITLPSISLWELREARNTARAESKGKINEDLIFRALERLNAYTEEASEKTKKTKKARRAEEKKKQRSRSLARQSVSAPPPERKDIKSLQIVSGSGAALEQGQELDGEVYFDIPDHIQ